MGKNNKSRRAAKAKQRARRGTPRSRAEGDPFDLSGEFFEPSPVEQVAALWFELHQAAFADRPDQLSLAERLAAHPAPVVDGYIEAVLPDILDALWESGWQPAEVRRQVRRTTTAAVARLVELAILAAHGRRSGQRIDPRWAEQLRAFKLRDVSTRDSLLATWRSREGLGRAEGYLATASVLAVLSGLPALDVLIPPPGAPDGSETIGVPLGTGGTQDPKLARVRKLLSKAESTDFEEEAAALTAKAQELMTRYAIDQARVEAPDDLDVPRMIRLPVDAPYADAKSLLLSVVAEANRCRAVFLSRLEMSSVAGHTGDLSVVELIFTSLLVQAQHALTEAARSDNYGRRGRSQSFRSSFFIAYAHRIGERLQGVNEQVFTESRDGASFLPVLRAREDAVADFVAERFGDTLVSSSVRGGYDYAGHAVGRRAADEAKLDSGELLR